MTILGIIPARYGSSRLEGKPLKYIDGKPMVQHVYERATQALENVLVATDDSRIEEAVQKFEGKVVRTGVHNTGTNRCLEALESYIASGQHPPEVILNIQGDEPLLDPEQLRELIRCFDDPSVQMASLVIPVQEMAQLHENSEVFVVMDRQRNALYFSRSVIPFVRDKPKDQWHKHTVFYRHVGLYAYTPSALRTFAGLPQSSLEQAESLEQNRWLENGFKIRLGITQSPSIAVDTAEDLERVRSLFRDAK